MKTALILPLAALAFTLSAGAQATRIWRCANNNYTNDAALAQSQQCKLVEGGNVTIVEGTRVNGNAAGGSGTRVANAPQSSGGQRVDANDQRARDSEARTILEAELKKAETRQADLLREWNNGEPEKQGPEHRNHQKYLDRVADLKASLSRNESDIAGLKRELSRVGGSAAAGK